MVSSTPVDEVDGVVEHRPAGGQDLAELLDADGAVGDLDGALDHRQGEALDAVAVAAEVAALDAARAACTSTSSST